MKLTTIVTNYTDNLIANSSVAWCHNKSRFFFSILWCSYKGFDDLNGIYIADVRMTTESYFEVEILNDSKGGSVGKTYILSTIFVIQ